MKTEGSTGFWNTGKYYHYKNPRRKKHKSFFEMEYNLFKIIPSILVHEFADFNSHSKDADEKDIKM